MTILLWTCALATAALLAVISFVQLLYLESMRLRSRDLPALDYFKDHFEASLKMKVETGELTFSLVKHTLILLLGLIVLAAVLHGRAMHWTVWTEAGLAAWLTLTLASYFIPQMLYRLTAARWLAGFLPLLLVVSLAVRPLVALLEFIQTLFQTDEKNGDLDENGHSSEDIEALIEAGAEEGLIEEGDRRLIQSVVEFGDTTVREVMTARPNMVTISADASLEEMRQLVIHEQFSRIPAYGESIDDIQGFVHVRDMFELDYEVRQLRTVRDVMRPIRIVPESKLACELLREMQQDNTHMVIVVDEYGNTAGLVTLEDLVEVIVGEIWDEHEPTSDIMREGENSYVVAGSFDVARLHDLFDFRPENETESTTVGGLTTEWLGHVPDPGEVIERDGIRIEVLASTGLRVEKVRLSRTGTGEE